MARSRRFIESNSLFEIVFRARSGIPLPCTEYMKLIVLGCLARTQRDDKVKLAHFVVMGNHVHIIVVGHRNEEAVTKFYMELKKKLTESIKQILDLDFLHLWDGPTTLIRILDLDKAIERIAYCYANPARANLADRVENYPGVSSWSRFQATEQKIGAVNSTKVKWYRYATLMPIGTLTPIVYLFAFSRFESVEHVLELHPNCWMSLFGVTDSVEVGEINQQIMAAVRDYELQARELRKELKKAVWSVRSLRKQAPTVSGYEPRTRDRKIFFLGSTKENRIEYLERFKAFVEHCAELFQIWRKGDFSVVWPPHAFIPWIPPLKCAAV